jgi:anti-sigma B factor antagonist
MKISINEKYQAAIIELKGDLVGGADAQLFRDKLYKLIKDGKKNVVVDMTDVKFMNSSGIGILISGYTTVKNAVGEMKLAHLPDKVKGILSITRLNKIFDIFDNVDDALNSFESGK